MAVDTKLEQVEARDLQAGMVVRLPADFKHPAGEWMTVERSVRQAQCMYVKFTNANAHHPRHDDPYEVKS
jgi:hypothetical protein